MSDASRLLANDKTRPKPGSLDVAAIPDTAAGRHTSLHRMALLSAVGIMGAMAELMPVTNSRQSYPGEFSGVEVGWGTPTRDEAAEARAWAAKPAPKRSMPEGTGRKAKINRKGRRR